MFLMGRGQANVSLPKQRYEELEQFLKDNEEMLKLFDVTNVPSLVKVLSNLGMKPLQEMLEAIRKVHTQTTPDTQSLTQK